MVLNLLRRSVVAAGILAAATCLTPRSQALAAGPFAVSGDLFYNYYVPPDPYWGLGAQAYVSPRPTPPWVGHTFVTYQPLMPHEFLYQHHRTYWRENPGAGHTRVHVSWGSGILDLPYVWGCNYHNEPHLPLTGK